MRKLAVLFVLAVSVLSTTSFALSHPPGWACPLKNLKKNQLRGADGTAFIPKSSTGQKSSASAVSARN